MADISNQIKQIESASRGEQVRDAIIAGIEAINNQGGNANTLDGHPAEDFVTATALADAINDMATPIDAINGEVVPGSITTKLTKTSDSKAAIKDAIAAKGVEINDEPLSAYADKIKMITTQGDNGDVTLSENGTFYASDYNYDAFRSVEVDVTPNLGEITITENGTVSASSQGYDGFSSVTVNVSGGGGGGGEDGWTVVFMNGSNVLQMDHGIPDGGTATYRGENPTKSGCLFTGWRPSNTNIHMDTVCYAQFVPIDVPGEIEDSWDRIVSNRGRDYALGEWKLLTIGTITDSRFSNMITNSAHYNEVPFGRVRMCKVDEGEDGSGSTWLSMDRIFYTGFSYNASRFSSMGSYGWGYCYNSDPPQIAHSIRQGLRALLDYLPPSLRTGIKEVSKYSSIFMQNFQTGLPYYTENYMTLDKIWIPSTKEIFNFGNNSGIYFKYIADMEEDERHDFILKMIRDYIDPEAGNDPITQEVWLRDQPSWNGAHAYTINYDCELATNDVYFPGGRHGKGINIGFCL